MDNIIKLNNEIQESKDNTIMRMMNDTTWNIVNKVDK